MPHSTRPDQHRQATRRLLAALGLVTVTASAIPLLIVPSLGYPGLSNLVYFTLFFIGLSVYWALGSLIVVRANGNAVGWLIVIGAGLTATSFASYALGLRLVVLGQPGAVAAWFLVIGAALFIPALFFAGPAVFITFPTGTLPARRWRWAFRVVAATVAVGLLGVLARPGSIDDGLPDNPMASWLPTLPMLALDAMDVLGQLSLALGAALAVVAVATRFRRAGRDERRQLTLFIAATIPVAISMPLGLVGSSGDLAANLSRMGSVEGARITDIVTVVSATLLTVAITVAIMRYRLYAIDRLISRTISYGLITAVLVGVFLLVNLGLQGVLSSVTSGNSLAVAGSTLLIAALFTPVRQRVQRVVDRRFDRARYDAEDSVAGLAGRLRDEVDIGRVAQDILDAVDASMKPTSVRLWLRPGPTR